MDPSPQNRGHTARNSGVSVRVFRLLLVIVAAIFGVELTIMLFLRLLLVSLPYQLISLIDATLLSIVLCPALYFLVYQPLSAEIMHRQRAEMEREELLAGLRAANDQLVAVSIRENTLSQNALRQAAELDATIASIADGVIIVGPDGEVVRTNATARMILRYSPFEMTLPLNERIASLHGQIASGRPLNTEEMPVPRALRRETVRGAIMVFHGTDRPVWVSMSAAPILTSTGELLGAVATLTDITALHDLEEQRDDYLRMISHDLRGPLTPIVGHAAWLQRWLASKGLEREARNAEIIATNAQRMNSMIEELVDTARLEAGRLPIRTELLDPWPLITDIVERVGTAEERSRLVVRCTNPVPRVAVDAERLERVVVNLLGNALKYSLPGTPIIVSVRSADGGVVVSVEDQGVGIAPDEADHVFDRYYRAGTAGKAEGLGLGLHIARLIVEAHGGHIWVESEAGKGTTFSFSLPAASARDLGA